MRSFLGYLALSVIVVSVYVGVAAAGGHSGFALDDAWIHQTYARNWAETGQLAYIVGQPSAGSTAPLWTLLISVAYRLHIDPYLWTLLLAAVSLALSAAMFAWLVGAAGVLEWHLIWAAASGMEAMLFIALALIVIDRTFATARSWSIGLAGGLLILTRPEGLVLIGLVAIVLLARSDHGGFKEFLILLITTVIVITPGALINLQASGTFFP